MKLICPWIMCKHNSFTASDEMVKKIVDSGIDFEGTGTCQCDNVILSPFTTEFQDEYMICDTYEYGAKFELGGDLYESNI